jgi:hypothetical protein
MVVKACSDCKSYVTLLKCSNWRHMSLDECIRERHHVTSWLSPVRDAELQMRKGCVLHSPPDTRVLWVCVERGEHKSFSRNGCTGVLAPYRILQGDQSLYGWIFCMFHIS